MKQQQQQGASAVRTVDVYTAGGLW